MVVPQEPYNPNADRLGWMGDAPHYLRSRELWKYYQPVPGYPTRPTRDFCSRNNFAIEEEEEVDHSDLCSSTDPALTCFTLLATKLLDTKRCMITLVDQERAYVIAESTKSLSIVTPHLHKPGDELWLGGCALASSQGGLCEATVSLMPPENNEDDASLFLEVPDLTKDYRWADAGFVKEWPYMKYYAGVALRSPNGISIGTFCVLDDEPRPDGLDSYQRATLTKLGDVVMSYLEIAGGDREMKRGRKMEMGLSRFIAEGFMPPDSFDLKDCPRGEGKLSTDKAMSERRRKEHERRRRVEQQRLHLHESAVGERKNAKGLATPPPEDCPVSVTDASESSPETNMTPRYRPPNERPPAAMTRCNTHSGFGERILQESPVLDRLSGLEFVPTVRPKISTRSRTDSTSRGSFKADSARPEEHFNHSPSPRSLVDMMHTWSQGVYDRTIGSHSTSSSVSSIHASTHIFQPKRYARSISTSGSDTSTRKSSYEISGSLEPSYRATFSRAAGLMCDSLELEGGVCFIDGDLEGAYDHDELVSEDGYVSAHVSTDRGTEASKRAERPKCRRSRSGILGYATSSGQEGRYPTQSSRRGSICHVDLPFDVAELNEDFIHKLVDRNPRGKIFPMLKDGKNHYSSEDVTTNFSPLDVEKEYDNQDGAVLKNFIPNCSSVAFVPLYDQSGKLFAACFGWTSNDRALLSEEVEGPFLAAFANSIMSEIHRLNIVGADKAKGDFISSVSHELRSPLHGILASADFLAESNLDSFQKSFVDTIISCGNTLLETVNNVLEFQKLNAIEEHEVSLSAANGSSTPARTDIRRASIATSPTMEVFKPTPLNTFACSAETDLSELVEEVTESIYLGYAFTADKMPDILESVSSPGLPWSSKTHEDGRVRRVATTKRDVTVVIDIDYREAGWKFNTQGGALRRVLNNLSGNAMKYTEQGFVKIRLKAKDLPVAANGEKRALVSISVTDSGVGISREFLKHKLYRPFCQENPLVSGTGLGMSIVRNIVGLLGGRIDVASQQGRGTKITVELELTQTSSLTKPDYEVTEPLGAEVAEARERLTNKLVHVTDFMPKNEGDFGQVQAMTILRHSANKYAVSWFGMTPTQDASKADIVIAHEDLSENLERDGREDKCPAQLRLCTTCAPDMLPRLSTLTTCAIKPIGPKKMASALLRCLGSEKTSSSTQRDPQDTDSCSMERAPSARTLITRQSTLRNPRHADIEPVVILPDSPNDSTKVSYPYGSTLHALLPSPPAKRPREKPRVLCVEDNAINLMLLTTFLKKRNYPFEKAVNGLEALEKVEDDPGGFDVILMDIQMPKMSGCESTAEIRKVEARRGIPAGKGCLIIALTGLAAVSDKQEAFNAGVDSFMVKPVKFKELERSLQMLRSGKMGEL